MELKSRKIRLLSVDAQNVYFEYLPDEQVTSMSKSVFDYLFMGGAFEVVNWQHQSPNSNSKFYESETQKHHNASVPTV